MKTRKNNLVIAGGTLMFMMAIIIIAVIIVQLNTDKSTGDIKIEGGLHYTGLKCTNNEAEHILFSTIKPVSQSNVIMANFADNKLSTITYQHEGVYSSEAEATNAEDYAIPNYNIILERDYGEKNNIFSHSFLKDGNKLTLTITGKSDKVSAKTAPYFMLSSTDAFPKTIDSMKSAYEKAGFYCEVFD